jgi:probable HAF family extracellular repeat protein
MKTTQLVQSVFRPWGVVLVCLVLWLAPAPSGYSASALDVYQPPKPKPAPTGIPGFDDEPLSDIPSVAEYQRRQMENKAAQQALALQRQQAVAAQAAADRAAAEEKQRILAQNMAAEAMRLTTDPRYQIPWHQTPPALKQHFFNTYGNAASGAGAAWNSALTQNTGRTVESFERGQAPAPAPAVAGSGPASTGTGFFITGDGFAVTNAHVVQGGAKFQLVTRAGSIAAKVVKVDSANDLALLKAEGSFAALPVATSRAVRLGSTVATVGFPNIGLQGFAPKLAKGEIAALSGVQDDVRYFQISVPVQPGNSGGALVDDRGNVVGIVSAKLSAKAALDTSGALPENVNYAVKSSFLLGFLESMPAVAAKLKEPNTKGEKLAHWRAIPGAGRDDTKQPAHRHLTMKLPTIKLGITLAGVLALVALPDRGHANAIAYTVTDLGALFANHISAANSTYGINASGQVVGVYGLSDGQFNTDVDAVRWTGTSMTNLSNNGGGGAAAYGINDSGQVVGFWKTNFPGSQATVWTGTSPQNLGDFGGHFSTAYGINNSGVVVGASRYLNTTVRAFRYSGGALQDIGTLGGNQSWAYGINDSGQITGASEYSTSSQRRHAFRDGVALENFGGFDSAGFSINASGQVAGYSDRLLGNVNDRHAVRWTGTTAEDLGTLPGYSVSMGYGINDSGDVVGNCLSDSNLKAAFLYTGGVMYDLNTLLLPGSGVTGLTVGDFGNSINNSGQIAAMGTINGQTHALLLTPTPEPASTALLLVGGALLGLRRRR